MGVIKNVRKKIWEAYRHTAAHIMAQAVKRLFPDVKLGIGPSIENGFYYDFDLNERITPEDLPKIEKENGKNHKRRSGTQKRSFEQGRSIPETKRS